MSLWGIVLLIGLLGMSAPVSGQIQNIDSLSKVRIGAITFAGNRVTAGRIIQRELSIASGDSLTRYDLAKAIIADQRKLYNLRLFNVVKIIPVERDPGTIDLVVDVEERWYTYPVPIFELSDRNFNEWWQNYDHDLSRINYGLRLYQYNFRGRNETLRLTAKFGFAKRFDLYYRIPNLTRNQRHGLVFELTWSQPTNLAYRTNDHILTFLKDEKVLRNFSEALVTHTYRPSFYQTHSIELAYRSNAIADTIFKLNPGYLEGRNSQWYTSLSYRFVAEHRDVIAYPLHGYQVTAGITKTGLGIGDQVNQIAIGGSFASHQEWSKNLFFSWYSAAVISSASQQPYNILQGIGYRRQYLRGYEVYVIEGPMYFLNKATLKSRLFQREISSGLPWEQFRVLPLSVYIKVFADGGLIRNYPFYENAGLNTRLTDKPLAGYGFGLDIIGYYDSVIRFEYTFTNQGTQGLFFHIRKEF